MMRAGWSSKNKQLGIGEALSTAADFHPWDGALTLAHSTVGGTKSIFFACAMMIFVTNTMVRICLHKLINGEGGICTLFFLYFLD